MRTKKTKKPIKKKVIQKKSKRKVKSKKKVEKKKKAKPKQKLNKTRKQKEIEQRKKERYKREYKLFKKFLKENRYYISNGNAIKYVEKFLKSRRKKFSIPKIKLLKGTFRYIKAWKKKQLKKQKRRLVQKALRMEQPMWFIPKDKDDDPRVPINPKYLTKDYEENKATQKEIKQIKTKEKIHKMRNIKASRYDRNLPLVLEAKALVEKKKWNKNLDEKLEPGDKVTVHRNQSFINEKLVRVRHEGKVKVFDLNNFKGLLLKDGEIVYVTKWNENKYEAAIKKMNKKLQGKKPKKKKIEEVVEPIVKHKKKNGKKVNTKIKPKAVLKTFPKKKTKKKTLVLETNKN